MTASRTRHEGRGSSDGSARARRYVARMPVLSSRKRTRKLDARAAACRRVFLHHFPEGFHDENYIAWERDYKLEAHRTWKRELGRDQLDELIANGDYATIAQRAVRIESRTNLLFSFEKMALRDA